MTSSYQGNAGMYELKQAYSVCERNLLRVLGIPEILRSFDLLGGGFTSERRFDARHIGEGERL